jgi:hypothetical protein
MLPSSCSQDYRQLLVSFLCPGAPPALSSGDAYLFASRAGTLLARGGQASWPRHGVYTVSSCLRCLRSCYPARSDVHGEVGRMRFGASGVLFAVLRSLVTNVKQENQA